MKSFFILSLLSLIATADTYHFYFNSQEKKDATVKAGEDSEQEESSDTPEETDNSAEPRAKSTQPNGPDASQLPPIVINNINNNDNSNRNDVGAPVTPLTPSAQAPAPNVIIDAQTGEPIDRPYVKPPRTTRLRAMLGMRADDWGMGGVADVGVSIRLSEWLAFEGYVTMMNTWVGHSYEQKAVGGDLVITPARVPFNHQRDLFELSLIYGRGTSFIGDHVGARASLSGPERSAFIIQVTGNYSQFALSAGALVNL